MGHSILENRHGMIMAVSVSEANGTSERAAALEMLDQLRHQHGVCPSTLGADKGYDSGPWFVELESRCVEPHCALQDGQPPDPKNIRLLRRAAVLARERMKQRLKKIEYQISQRCRKK
jgi:hypothetical protein